MVPSSANRRVCPWVESATDSFAAAAWCAVVLKLSPVWRKWEVWKRGTLHCPAAAATAECGMVDVIKAEVEAVAEVAALPSQAASVSTATASLSLITYASSGIG